MLMIALSVAGCAGYFSVWGLSQLFAGASTAVIIMATVLEIAKVVTTTALHRYWSNLARGLKIYLSTGVVVLMIITSAGIYGFLSNAYQKTANKLEIHQGELSVLDGKKAIFEKNISDNEKIIVTKNKRIDQLTNLRNNQEIRLDSAKTQKAKAAVRNDIALATQEIQKLTTDIDGLNLKNNIQADSVGSYNVKALELKASSEIAGEVGPLKYISELTGAPMAKVVNYLILLLIFVFDPLAIALIISTNRIFELEQKGITQVPIKKDSTKKVLEDAVEFLKQEDIKQEVVIESELIKEEIVKEEPLNDTFLIENEEVSEEPIAESIVEESYPIEEVIEKPVEPIYKKEPVIPTGKVELQDIKEIKENQNRGFSVPIPLPKKSNSIERIDSNKEIKDGNSNRLFFKRNK